MKRLGNKKLADLCRRLIDNEAGITPERRSLLESMADGMYQHIQTYGRCDVVAICTHNSRRSQLVEIWLAVAAGYYGLDQIRAWSGGTEVTAFNYRAVYALQYRGFDFYKSKDGDNPHYRTHDIPDHTFFSKTYDDPYNPEKDFLALTVCDHADKNCPLVAGANLRFFVPYVDPKMADDSDEEVKVYADKVDEIGREIFYCIKVLKTKLDESA